MQNCSLLLKIQLSVAMIPDLFTITFYKAWNQEWGDGEIGKSGEYGENNS